ncbi:CDK5RAP1-like protein [Leptopilina heterotoma]|uniref:CDK5RAP1-like protein n=1 Tax=Leptopilina heterotoma TaxID=63436 RepID=UPI001CA86796|nr:CDK5RAP1-like protein [Leptopilina heterotoma]
MNSIEFASRSGIGILRKFIYKLPTWTNSVLTSSEIQNSPLRHFHKTNLHYTETQESVNSESVLEKTVVSNDSKIQKPKIHFDDKFKLENFMPKRERPILKTESVPYLKGIHGDNKKVFLDVYGCQMNVSDGEIILSILKENGYKLTKNLNDADIILVLTCAIRENAERKIWVRLKEFRHIMNKKRAMGISEHPKIGLLGCMAERLKHKLLVKDRLVDIVAGPDSYKDLPRLLAIANDNQTAINVILSADETYADITPVRLHPDSISAFVTIMRGCDNMCTYCIVPFTRGRERSRPLKSIEDEVRQLSDNNVKEIILLGQNVNSYLDYATEMIVASETELAKGFRTVYKNKTGGLRFCDLLDKISLINPEMRIRFTSPHPKDFPDSVLQLIAERPNICKSLHLPVQSGNSSVLQRMRRGYTRESYLELIENVRNIIPNVSLSSDFIAGFCGETHEEFEDTISIMELVKYNQAFLFAYSMREKTPAHRRFEDDVNEEVKRLRLIRMTDVYRNEVKKLNEAQIGQQQLVLIEGTSKKNANQLIGRNDGNIRVIIPNSPVEENRNSSSSRQVVPGDYVAVQIVNATSQTLRGVPLYLSSIAEFTSSTEQTYNKAFA